MYIGESVFFVWWCIYGHLFLMLFSYLYVVIWWGLSSHWFFVKKQTKMYDNVTKKFKTSMFVFGVVHIICCKNRYVFSRSGATFLFVFVSIAFFSMAKHILTEVRSILLCPKREDIKKTKKKWRKNTFHWAERVTMVLLILLFYSKTNERTYHWDRESM